jgi:hypothetical protein
MFKNAPPVPYVMPTTASGRADMDRKTGFIENVVVSIAVAGALGITTLVVAGTAGAFGSRGLIPQQQYSYRSQPLILMKEDVRGGLDQYFLQLPDGSRIYKGRLILDNGDTLVVPEPRQITHGSF